MRRDRRKEESERREESRREIVEADGGGLDGERESERVWGSGEVERKSVDSPRQTVRDRLGESKRESVRLPSNACFVFVFHIFSEVSALLIRTTYASYTCTRVPSVAILLIGSPFAGLTVYLHLFGIKSFREELSSYFAVFAHKIEIGFCEESNV